MNYFGCLNQNLAGVSSRVIFWLNSDKIDKIDKKFTTEQAKEEGTIFPN